MYCSTAVLCCSTTCAVELYSPKTQVLPPLLSEREEPFLSNGTSVSTIFTRAGDRPDVSNLHQGTKAPFPPQSPTWDATRTPKSDLLYFAQNIANRNMGRTRKQFTVLFGSFSQMAATFDFLLKLGWSSTSPDIELLVRNFDIFDIV